MNRVIKSALLMLLLSGITARAQDDFNPSSPTEPGAMTAKLALLADPAEGGSVSGGGAIVPGEHVTLTASPGSGFTFVNWTDAAGNVVSDKASFAYTKQEGKETLIAHFRFQPGSPGEPDQLPTKLTLTADEGGSVSGGGWYKEGVTVNIRAYSNTGFEFTGWYYADGTLYSADAATTFTMVDHALTLTARFAFNPSSPSEPDDNLNAIHHLKLVALEGGTVSAGSYLIEEGQSVKVRAYANSGYQFAGWYNGEEIVSETAEFDYVMGSAGVTLTAHFLFMPQSPGEPDEIRQRTFSFTLYHVITKPGTTAEFPIYLTPRATLKDMTFQIHFSTDLNVDVGNVTLGETTEAYEMECEDLGTEDGLHGYKYTLTGGSIAGDNVVIPILTFPVIIPADTETGTSRQVKINQISMTNEDGTTQTAGTRNGRISVYKLGDTNGDDAVDASDVLNMVNVSLSKTTEVFIKEVSDINGDDEIDSSDVLGVVNISLNNN